MARTMEALQNVTDGGTEQQSLLQKTGQLLATVVGNNLSTASTETEIELNFAVVKIKHKFIRKEDDNKWSWKLVHVLNHSSIINNQ